MQAYTKPQFIVEESSAEGVYMASGATESAQSDITASVVPGNQGNEWYRVANFAVTLKNNTSETLTDWSYTLSVTSGTATSVSTYDNSQANVSFKNDKITLTTGQWGQISPGGSITVQLVVNYEGNGVTIG